MSPLALTDGLHHTLRGHAGPAVALLHGLGSSSADWPEQLSLIHI